MKIYVDEKPKNCFECLFSHNYGYDRYCKITHYPFEREEVKQIIDKKVPQPFVSYDCGDVYENCPLIEQKECVKREKGEWKCDRDGRIICSVCKKEATSFDDVYHDFETSWCTEDFCPHCGADMRSEQE